ncbi:MAG: isoprenylcysteine carboxylmethyltransferase family protein [Deltaproteobacteria bacterium]|nr:MAG: isoprenylcysteine carboxylmethyltransferase family protein [Deltaproteobacteria bacterium]
MVSGSPHQQTPLPSGVGTPPPAPAGVRVWLRRYRRYLPMPLCLIALVGLRPVAPWGSMWLDTVTDALGVGLCALGQGLRLWAWGSNAEVGKGGVRARGPYVLMRHPLYTGNFLILLGLVVIFNNPWAYPLFLVPFAYLYHVITDMEEKRMHRRFGADYQEYRGRAVPRFLPALGNLGMALRTTLPFGWELAWRKEGESCCGWLAGVVVLEAYEGVLARGWAQNWLYTQRWLVVLGLISVVALSLQVCKRLKPV